MRKDYVKEDVKTSNFGEFRSESISKIKISHHSNCINSDKESVIKSIDIISSGTSTESARVTVRVCNSKYIG